MIDPVTALLAPLAYGVWRLINAYAEAATLRARADMVRAGAALRPGTEISGQGRDGSQWTISVPVGALPPAAGARHDK